MFNIFIYVVNFKRIEYLNLLFNNIFFESIQKFIFIIFILLTLFNRNVVN